jgi:von Willebrand factor type A domain
MGGTEIYAPLSAIFSRELIKRDSTMMQLERQVLLLTDGGVSNTQTVVNLIKQHSSTSATQVHTFGIGKSVSTELVKNAAMAGRGHFYFID